MHARHRALSIVACLGALTIGGQARAQTAPPPTEGAAHAATPEEGRLRALEERLQRQEEALAGALRRVDEQGGELRRLRAQVAATPTPVRPAVGEILGALELSGFVQADAVVYRQSSRDEVNGATGEPLNEQRFLIRRAQLRAEITREILSGALALEASTVDGATVRPIEAQVSVRWQGPSAAAPPILMVTLGLFKIPFGVEVPERDVDRHFLERSHLARAFFPGNFDLGLRLQGGYRFLRYSAALMNGEPIGERGFPARDPSAAKDLLGRVGIDTQVLPWLRLAVGFSGLTGQGFHQGTPSTKDVLVWRDANENGLVELSEIQAISGSAAEPSESFRRFALGGDVRITARVPLLGELSVSGEIIRAQNLDRGLEIADPVGMGRDLRELGWYLGVTQELGRYAVIGLRYDRYDPDADADEQRAATLVPRDRSFATIAAAASLRLAPGRLVAEYDHNDNTLGRTAGGLPTRLADDAFTLRAELVF